MNQTYDTVVIGGGVAGLIAAIDIAKTGKSVVLLEKSNQIGGRGITVNKNGALFNLGGHALYKGGEAYRILKELGIRLEGGSPPAKGFGIWNNKLVTLPGDPLSLLTSSLLSWPGKMELGKILMKLNNLQPATMDKISLREWAEKSIQDPMVRHIFYALCRTATYTQDLDYQLVGPVIRQVQLSLKDGVLYLHGGWQAMIDQLLETAKKVGATVQTNQSVKQILHANGHVTGIQLANGEIMTCRIVLAATPLPVTYSLVQGAEGTTLHKWKKEARPAMAACLDLSLRKLPVPNRHLVIGLDQPLFFSHHSRIAKLSENGTMVVHVIKYNGAQEANDPKADERKLEQTMDLIHPGWQKEVAARQFLPNISVVADTRHIGQTGPLPGPALPEISGLYVAGDWVSHGEMLVDASAASARRASERILKDLAVADSLLAI